MSGHRPFATCADCGFVCATQTEFSRHCDNHAGIVRPDGWYAPVRPGRTYAQWDDSTAIELHVDPKTGDVRYPMRHDAPLKAGYERQFLRSLPEVNRFEREHAVVNERMHFDRNGRGLDDTVCGERLTH